MPPLGIKAFYYWKHQEAIGAFHWISFIKDSLSEGLFNRNDKQITRSLYFSGIFCLCSLNPAEAPMKHQHSDKGAAASTKRE